MSFVKYYTKGDGKACLVAPGAKAAQADIALPAYAQGASKIIAAILFQGSDGTAAALATNLTVVSAAPAAGEVWLKDANTIQVGNAITTRDFVILILDFPSKTIPLG